MFFLFSANCLSAIFCIILFSTLSFAIGARYKALKTKYASRNNLVDSFHLDYDSFVINVDALSRASGTRLLTNDARIAVVQQNIHSILQLLFGDHRLAERFSEYFEASFDEELKDYDGSDKNTTDFSNERFIHYDKDLNCLYVTKVTRKSQQSAQSLRYYLIKAQLPHYKSLV